MYICFISGTEIEYFFAPAEATVQQHIPICLFVAVDALSPIMCAVWWAPRKQYRKRRRFCGVLDKSEKLCQSWPFHTIPPD